ncbi:hypothetical protein [Natrinema versiforme]|uniref:Uncharacterized protein n=1 Tax=Natrinema versiforme JCM 10478 TaxID=1227496 RepID=L9YAC4_9EURY|nr:hypothetical protein [Natrinema versiforme]ELY71004.1 hypothetical protein C489_01561 [Natrinema versiforme JCM 10478]
MSDESPFESVSLTAQVVLLGVAELAREDETPVQTHDLRRHCKQQLSAVDTEVVGTITEADVIRSLYQLEDEGLVDEVEPTETSPTGKGRPAYALAVTADAVYDGVDDELLDGTGD